MAQRLLSGFHALDKYSQDVLAKHAKKRHLSYLQRIQSLNVPLSFDFEPETRQGSAGKRWERKRNSHLSSRSPSHNAGGQSGTRPSTAAGCRAVPDCEEKEREPTEGVKPRCESARQRRPWRSEVECIPGLDTLCQEERTGPLCSVLRTPCSHSRSSLLSPIDQLDHSMGTVNSHQPTRQDDIRADGTMTSNKSKRGSDITDDKNPSREKIQKAAVVSLTIEEEMKKSDVRVITVAQKTEAEGPGRVSDTQPTMYNNYHHNKFVVFNTPSGLHRPAGNKRQQRGTGSMLPNNTDYIRHAIKTTPPILHTGSLKKNKANNVLLSDNAKVIIHFLSADGTKQKVDFATEGKVPKEEQLKNQGNGKTSLQELQPTLRAALTGDTMDAPRHVGLIINGMNPKTAADHEQSTHSSSPPASRSFCPSSPRAPSSQSLRLNSGGEIQKWSYISISKPLSLPDSQLSSLQSNNSALITGDIMEDKVRPTSGVVHRRCPGPLSTKPLALESRKGRQGSVPAEISSLGADFGGQTTMGSTGEETGKGGGEIVVALDGIRSPSAVTEPPNTKSPKNGFGEQERKLSPTSAHLTAIPVISIPTAPIDISE
ncbi:uncharacterized protein C1orf141 homolog isoform X2 [Pseudophryne corroboree]|uniref:uncharacterized protein C1orf141 homolog isoform X2 n=1 Tax=Pseudophryne corroboree TaxID=495146 RepID=UPI00308122E0